MKDRCGRWSDEPRAEGNCVEREPAWRGSRSANPGPDGQKSRKEAWSAG